jgi:hypothetical protein
MIVLIGGKNAKIEEYIRVGLILLQHVQKQDARALIVLARGREITLETCQVSKQQQGAGLRLHLRAFTRRRYLRQHRIEPPASLSDIFAAQPEWAEHERQAQRLLDSARVEQPTTAAASTCSSRMAQPTPTRLVSF